MKIKSSLIMLVIALFCSISTQAQFGKMLKNKVKNAAKNVVKEEASTTTTSSSGPSGGASKMPGSVPGSPYTEEAGNVATSLKFLDPMGSVYAHTTHIVTGANYKEGELEQGHAVVIQPDYKLEYSWLVFISPKVLDGFAIGGTRVYEMTSGSYIVKHPADPNQQLEIGITGPILSRMLKVEEDVFILYAGQQVGGHAYNVPSYIVLDDLYIMNVIAPEEKLAKYSKEEAKKIAVEMETKLKANYDAAAKADLASIKIPSAGKLNSDASLKNFAKTEINKVVVKDGGELIHVNIESNDWNIVHHKVTGRPLYRWIRGAFTEKLRSGKCKLQGYLLKQQYNGSGYSNTTFGGVIHGQMPYGQYIDCNNTKP
ncbi:hypothetical protein [Mesonia phycicola]|nr:hypothetical protein [Mesonia phycicola]